MSDRRSVALETTAWVLSALLIAAFFVPIEAGWVTRPQGKVLAVLGLLSIPTMAVAGITRGLRQQRRRQRSGVR
ncbi:hypothetical protein [Kineococcus gypseus]|uniref:hypothetical protein n=1 Tax=Kineococcus gypseus TaxID=1637102 RepID=UPI003D7D66AD